MLLHVLGAGHWQMPTLRRARDLGHRVLVTDYLPDRPGYALADIVEVADLTDSEATLAAARRHRADGVLCDTTDTGVRTAAIVTDRLGLPSAGVAAATACTDKALLHARLVQAGLAAPAYRELTASDDVAAVACGATWPAVVKPVDNQSGRGVAIVHAASDLDAAVAVALRHSRSGRVLFESMLPGVEHIVDGFVAGAFVAILGIAVKTPYADNPTLARRIAYLGGAAFDAACQRLRPTIERTLAALGLRQGVFHAELMVDGDAAVPIDIAARGGGVMIYSHVLPAICGVDAIAASINAALGLAPAVSPTRRRAACIEFLRAPPGRIEAIEGAVDAQSVPGVIALHFGVQAGDTPGPLRAKDDRPGFIVGVGDSDTEVAQVVAAARERLHIRVAGEPGDRPFD